MKTLLLIPFSLALAAVPVWAEKPEWAGKGKPAAEQVETHTETMKAKSRDDEADKPESQASEKGSKMKKEKQQEQKSKPEKAKAALIEDRAPLEKQQGKKMDHVQKETDSGSEQGQESRQERKKWWRFWE
ncbi:MAG: hypothetical protein R3208_08275 [Ketobacteraceae bacterium]|nr:hypothetical protein [Ketobacteraceae bacterium]